MVWSRAWHGQLRRSRLAQQLKRRARLRMGRIQPLELSGQDPDGLAMQPTLVLEGSGVGTEIVGKRLGRRGALARQAIRALNPGDMRRTTIAGDGPTVAQAVSSPQAAAV